MRAIVVLQMIVIVIVAVIVIQTAATENIFVKNFNRLHRAPGRDATNNQHLQTRDRVITFYIKQKLDHFNKNDNRTWSMRYMSNDNLYRRGGPMFIFVGGEWSITAATITSGHVYDMAKEHNAYLFYTEHRYYGLSQPLPNLSNENLEYLSVRQALEDLAHFIRSMKDLIPSLRNSKVILIGGSYSANMVTWFRKLYPSLVDGCWASSAPLLAVLDFYEYKEEMTSAIELVGGQNCYERIKNGIEKLEYMLQNHQGAEVKSMLRLCNSFDESNDLDVATLFYAISEIFASIVQAHNDGDIQEVCREIMKGDDNDDVNSLASYLIGFFNTTSCIDMTYIEYLTLIMDTNYGGAMRQWTYQTCNEFGYFQTSSSLNQAFGSRYPLVFFTAACCDAFGSEFTAENIESKIELTNDRFEGIGILVKNVYMTHGQLDPWKVLGIQKGNLTTVIPMYAHCKDLGSISASDSKEMLASKKKIASLVREWLAG